MACYATDSWLAHISAVYLNPSISFALFRVTMRVLVVEDDSALAAVIARGLREASYAVDVVTDGAAAVYHAAVNTYDAIVLDVMLPGQDGFEVCREIRGRANHTPVLMLTARDTITDKVTGLDAGADDYLTKPFDFAELLARLRALLRRGAAVLPQTIAVGDVEIDTAGQYVLHDGRRIPLTTKEYALLEYLARHAGRVVGREELCAHVWDENHDPWSNAIEVCVARVRRKLESVGAQAQIQTRRGAGYAFADGETPLA